MRMVLIIVTAVALNSPLQAQVANPTPDQVRAAIARGIRQPGQSQGLVLVDNFHQTMQSLGEIMAGRGQLPAGTQVDASGFSVRILTPLAWIAQIASIKAAQRQTFTVANVTADMLRPVLRVAAFPSTPPRVGLNVGMDVSPVSSIYLTDARKKLDVQPLSAAPLIPLNAPRVVFGQTSQLRGLLAIFSLDDLARIREGKREFFVVVVGSDNDEKTFKVKRRYFGQLP